MLFSSVTFLYYFLPITVLLYFCVPVGRGTDPLRGKNSLLLIASFLFYAVGEPVYVLLMLASVFVGYLGGRILEIYRKKVILWCFVGIQLLLLGIFKYTDFLIDTWNRVIGAEVSFLYFVLPIGISFYSFQIISYIVDVYRRNLQCEKNFLDFATYIAMFPQLIAGPIVRYDIIQPQMKARKICWENVNDGATRFLIGLGKKVLLADNLGEQILRIEQIDTQSVWSYWMIAILYVLQIYHDFSGYSDMAIGLGKMFGFDFPENFQYPLIAKSITEFWKRWHISLGTFLKDYIYIPLRGNQCSVGRWILNIAIVWFLSGLWHGASWNFVLWGLYFGAFLVVEKFISSLKIQKKSGCAAQIVWRGLKHGYTCVVVIISFVLFRFVNIKEAEEFLVEMFRIWNVAVSTMEWYEYKNTAFLLLISVVGATPFATSIARRFLCRVKSQGMLFVIERVFQVAMLLVVTAYLIQSSVHPFLYFRF